MTWEEREMLLRRRALVGDDSQPIGFYVDLRLPRPRRYALAEQIKVSLAFCKPHSIALDSQVWLSLQQFYGDPLATVPDTDYLIMHQELPIAECRLNKFQLSRVRPPSFIEDYLRRRLTTSYGLHHYPVIRYRDEDDIEKRYVCLIRSYRRCAF